MKKIILVLALICIGLISRAQTNIQVQYDFGRKNLVTATIEGNYSDSWGSTYFFTDFDLAKVAEGRGAYGEFSRSFNFWQKSKLADLSVQAEVDAGIYKDFLIAPAFLAGLNYTFHDETFRNFLQVQVLYKTFFNAETSVVPMQFTLVWGCNDLFNAKGLTFMGFADFWWQDQQTGTGLNHIVFMTEPQIWYNVGQWFKCPNLNIGGEVELAVNFDTVVDKHFTCYPSAGIKWIF